MLDINELQSGYGETQVLFDVSLQVKPGRVHAILGRNGAGKSTTLKTVMGLLKAKSGAVEFDGEQISGRQPFKVADMGIAYVPETRDIFPSLTVLENLELTQRRFQHRGGDNGWTLEKIYEAFPRLKERAGNYGDELSGGEQQMLTIARALLMNPKLLILDEPTEGLAPIIVKQIHKQLSVLKQQGLTILLVEQNFGFATSLADDVSIIGKGQVVWRGSANEIREDKATQHQWLGV
ncbi:ABC transporter ATP-binding protein [Marinobacterium mangrovicola]|uniref:Amino acid/amide ABC transporter ATP-binding protein 2 (HAAT family) n=1 Tax=Marinobacterium mangrovicola TaxID=1476959 RepID=A0A4R1GLH9_9GAMM|nr:ABC transporter ATP-binding protein [Marinobacterium mangrovicola]TCK06969.1 amino acid/amide ABC transporter ATP-binding protein 2 (HAAT family) [Marinobacterium mangrovicola]